MKNGVKLLLYWGAYVLICLFFMETGYGQSRSLVTGTVVNEANKPLAGVTVNVDENGNKSQRQTTATDAYGMFRFTDLKVGIPYNLSFTYLGYQPQELPEFIVKSGDNNSILIRMKISESTNLSEVVVVGYGTQKKQNITGSIATVKAEDLTDVASPNVGSLLQGKVAGLEVSNSSGQPGAMPKVKVRGISSISASQVPIWVVDGVIQHDVPNLNPQDIESISVLKDAASAALYGSRGANGVIVVTTKAAKAGITTVNFSGKTGVSVFNTGQFSVMNSQQLYDFWTAFPNTKDVPSWFNNTLTGVNTDWIAMGTQHGVVQDYNLSVSGGTDKTKVYAAGNYFQEKGTVKGMVYDRFTGRLNLDQKLGDKLTFSPKLFASYTKTDNRQHDINALFTYLPWDKPYDDKGNVINAQAAGSGWRGRDLSNYYYDLQWNYTQGNRYNAMVNLDFSYKILPFLEFKSTNNLTYLVDKGLIYTDPQSISGMADNGRIKNSNAYRTTRFTNQMLTFNKTFGLHTLSALAAYEYNDYKYDDNSATGIGIVSGITVLSGASKASGVTGTANHYAFQSMLMNANYSYDDRYVLQASLRRDGSSRFGSNTKYGNFFSFSGAWNIHREAFFESSTVNFLRLKAAYGGVGNTPETLYPQYELFSVNAQYNGTPTVFPSALGNKSLTWEKSYSTNIGVETGLFDRLNLTLELYRKNTSDLLHFVPLPDVSGYKGYWDNIGRVMNKGAELTIDAKLVRGATFTWDLGVNLGINRNKVMELYGGNRQINGNQVIEEGNDINTWYMRKWTGVNAENGTPQWEIIDNKTGERSLTGSYAAASLQKVGRATPDYFGGINTKMNYNHFYLTANMAFTKGIQVYNAGRELFDSDGAYATYNQMDLKSGWSRWTSENKNATHPQALFGGNNRSNGTSSRYLEDGSYLRLRNVTLGYKWTGKMLERLKVKGINTNISIDNIFTITNYSGIDPEAAASGGTTSPYPLPKRIMFGVDIQF